MTDEDPIDGCAECGVAQREHGQRYTVAAGWHVWTEPDPWLFEQRIRYRRLTRAIARNLRVKERS